MAAPTHRDSDKFIVRLPDGMRERIRAAAEANNRSMNAEIVHRLEQTFLASPALPADLSGVDLAITDAEKDALRAVLAVVRSAQNGSER